MKRNIYIQQPNIKNMPHIYKEKGKKEKERHNSVNNEWKEEKKNVSWSHLTQFTLGQ